MYITSIDPWLCYFQIGSIHLQIEALRNEFKACMALRDDAPSAGVIELPDYQSKTLIRMRIARHLTEEQMGNKADADVAQFQKRGTPDYQGNRYAIIF